MTAKYRRRVFSPRTIDEYIRSQTVRKLQIGAGPHSPPGWLNTDITPRQGQAYLDAAKPFPLPDGSFHYVFAEHMIEHLTYEEGIQMVRESHRILAPGGKIRLATPDLLKLVNILYGPATDQVLHFINFKIDMHSMPETPDPECYVVNSQMGGEHKFLYTPKMLRAVLEKSGFQEVRQYAPGQSDDPQLSTVEFRPRTTYREMDAYETMIFQGVKR